MNIRVLGCHGAQLPHHKTTSFLINSRILVDAGTVTTVLNLPEQMKIDYIFVTHAHLDHIRDIAFLADNVYFQRRKKPILVISTKGIIKAISRHIFNNVIWPDFSRLPSPHAPLIKFKIIKSGQKQKIGDLQVKAIDLHHVVESVSYVVESKGKAVMFFGDTGPTEMAWKQARRTKCLRALFIETSLPDNMMDVACKTGHLTPRSLSAELKKLTSARPDVYLYHMKPKYKETICREIAAIQDRKIHIIEDGQIIRV